MAEDTTLVEKRDELKRRLAVGEYRTLVDIMFDKTGRFIQKLTRSAEPPSSWYSAVFIGLAMWLIGLLTSILLGEFNESRRDFIPVEIVSVVIVLASLLAIRLVNRVLATMMANHVLDAIKSEADLADFEAWLIRLVKVKEPLWISLIYSIVSTGYVVILLAMIGAGPSGFGPILFSLLGSFLAATPIYYLFVIITLPSRLSRYEFDLYPADPSSSEVIDHLSDMFMYFMYIGMAVGVISSLAAVLLDLAAFSYLIFIALIIWGPLTAFFIITQTALTRIIPRVKWKKLNQIQAVIRELEMGQNLAEMETMEAVNRLMDYHNRIKATRNSALDLRAGLNFLNSLLLPLLAFLVGNLDKVLDFFS